MKRVLTILAILLLPLSVWAMTPINDSDLSNVTGQAGVNINANLTMDIAIGTMAWGDVDGITGVYNPWTASGSGYTAGGYIGMSGFNINNLTIKARTETDDAYNYYSTLMLKPITIDVATDSGTGHGLANTTFVRFGTGALQINMDALQFDVSLGARPAAGATAGANAVALTQNMGVVSLGGMAIYLSPWSYVDIYAANTATDRSGVCFSVNVTVDHFAMQYASWGDKDGYIGANTTGTVTWFAGATPAPGYIGLDNIAINGPINIKGTVQIDVNTCGAGSGIYALLPGVTAELIADGLVPANGQTATAIWLASHTTEILAAEGNAANQIPVTVVHISFPRENFVVNVAGSITAAVKLDSTFNFASAQAATMGDIYISGFTFTMHTGSWVDIWAH